MRLPFLVAISFLLFSSYAEAQQWIQRDTIGRTNQSFFRPIDSWPQPNDIRTQAGKPGKSYWQQRADYQIKVSLDTTKHLITGTERITYFNNSPDVLTFLWVQVDQNIDNKEFSRASASQGALPEQINPAVARFLNADRADSESKIHRVQLVDKSGRMVNAKYFINGSVMRINLIEPLLSGGKVSFEIDWSYIVLEGGFNGRGAREKVKGGHMYEIAQWFPRMCVYDDINGWQTDQFLGQGEFYLNFGDYDVKITVPWDHIVEATGVLQNPKEVLTSEQQERLKQAYTSTMPRFIIAPEEVGSLKSRPKNSGNLTWHFKAENVRDFAWVSSRTYVWDAAGYKYPGQKLPIACHSLYPREAMPLWDSVSTKAIIQTMETYGRMAFEYPYPKAVNVHGPVFGMEYPMIAFCGVRPNEKGKYTKQQAYALISVTIHEVGHNWFPMIVASDERTWSWMDEGLNSFLQYYAEKAWDKDYPSRRGPAKNIVGYMKDPDQTPIMAHSDVINRRFGDNAYGKPAAGLVMLREQILKPDIFDEAFRDYCQTWMFKHPQPHDFFRTIEQATGEDLAYFWRGWFYTTHANDQAITDVVQQNSKDLLGEQNAVDRPKNYYRVKIENKGGLLLPVKMKVTYADGSSERMDLPADIWRKNERTFIKGFFSDKEVAEVVLDPDEVMADINTANNVWKNPTIQREETKKN
jgi:hypothetical protein